MTVALFGRTRDREWKLDNYTWTCDSCKEKERAESGARAAVEAIKNGFPPLSGSDKQVAWAERIRLGNLNKVETEVLPDTFRSGFARFCSEVGDDSRNLFFDSPKTSEEANEAVSKVFSQFIDENTQSRFWIDNRHDMASAFYLFLMEKFTGSSAENAKLESDEELATDSVEQGEIIQPDGKLVTEAIAEIKIKEKSVEINLPEKIEEFRLMVKAAGYVWHHNRWTRSNEVLRYESAAYVGQQALALGIRIIVLDEKVAATIKKGEAKACWITSSETHAYLRWWAGDWYRTCKSLPGARWEKPDVKVDLKYREEILDFAEREGFGVTGPSMERLQSPVKKETVKAVPVQSEPEPRPELKAEKFGVAASLEDVDSDEIAY